MSIYSQNIQAHSDTLVALAKTLKKLAIVRLAVFVFSLILVTVLANERLLILLLVIAPLCVIGFGLAVRRYHQVNYLKRHTAFLKEINEVEVLRLENKLTGFESGYSFLNHDHVYSADLDIFGPHSLFQLLNRTTTGPGRELLAEWLTAPAEKALILRRQQAVQELAPKLDWRQQFQASGMHFKRKKSDFKKLLAWVEKPLQLLPKHVKYLSVSIPLSMLSTLAALYYVVNAFSPAHILPLLVVLVVNALVLRRIKPIAEETLENTQYNITLLGRYRHLITHIEGEKFHSSLLRDLQSVFSQNRYSATRETRRLEKILEVFHMRGIRINGETTGGHFFYQIFNLFWLFDVYWVILTEKWKQKNSSYLRSWAAAVGEFEVLSSLAGFFYSNPSYCFPGITGKPSTIRFEALGHPLIHPASRVYNHFDLSGQGTIAMITGSNMAGKSTFLRTVGINLVLALMGGPCCATSGQVSNIRIFTSMRTQDNLEEGISSFYAELKRIEQLLELIKENTPLFFMLDEMFKGTNSADRHIGGFSLIKQLNELNAFGMISTHDLELAKLAGKHGIVINYSFNSEIREGEMTFNYKLTPGLCRDFNASELMRRSGINVLPTIEAGSKKV